MKPTLGWLFRRRLNENGGLFDKFTESAFRCQFHEATDTFLARSKFISATNGPEAINVGSILAGV
jgi:hypothetical protein